MTPEIKELVKRLRAANYSDQPEWTPLEVPLDEAGDALEALAGEVLAAEKRNLESSVNGFGWMRLSDALKHIIWKHPDAAKEMMAADLPPLPAPYDAVELVAERDRLAGEVERLKGVLGRIEKATVGDPEYGRSMLTFAGFLQGVARSALEAKP